MLTERVSFTTEDALDVATLRQPQGEPSLFAMVPPPPTGQEDDDKHREACRLVSVNLSAYMDNELDPEQVTLINNHLYQCSDCAALLEAMEDTDNAIEREWRDRAPLPLSSDFRHAVDDIMDALPPVTREDAPIAPKRIHARARWIRFATGISGVVLFASLLWSSYQLGYAHGRHSQFRSSIFRSGSSRRSTDSTRIRYALDLSSPGPLQTASSFVQASHVEHISICKIEAP